MSLSQILRKCQGGNKYHKLQPSNVQGRHQPAYQKQKRLETLIMIVRIYSENIGMEFGIEKCAMLIMKNEKQNMTEKIKLPNQKKKKSEQSEKRRLTNTWGYWKRIPSSKWK